ncbi:MAG TPA: hypothetical protein VEO01_40590 [Pseudonocardiaceae bacterium]|nr:hypothetical protein [Pseudonocardiaceae bacterium]
MAPTLSQGSGTGLSLTSNLFTLSSGIWDVDYNIELSSGIGTNTFLNLVISSNTTASVPTGWLAGGTGSGNATTGFLAGCASYKILSDGTATVAFKIFSPGSGPSGVLGGVSMTFVRDAIV